VVTTVIEIMVLVSAHQKALRFFSHILLLSFPHTIDGWVVSGSVMVG